MTDNRKQIIKCVSCCAIFLVINAVFFLLGDYPKHILEGFRDYINSTVFSLLRTLLNLGFWTLSVLFIWSVVNCNKTSSVTEINWKFKKKFVILLVIQMIFDIASWFIMYSDSTYVYGYRTIVILLNWIFIYRTLSPEYSNSTENSKYKYIFIVSSVLISCIFIILDFIDIETYQKVSSSLNESVFSDASYNNYMDYMLAAMNLSELMEKICEQRHFVLDSVIGIMFFIVHTLMTRTQADENVAVSS